MCWPVLIANDCNDGETWGPQLVTVQLGLKVYVFANRHSTSTYFFQALAIEEEFYHEFLNTSRTCICTIPSALHMCECLQVPSPCSLNQCYGCLPGEQLRIQCTGWNCLIRVHSSMPTKVHVCRTSAHSDCPLTPTVGPGAIFCWISSLCSYCWQDHNRLGGRCPELG